MWYHIATAPAHPPARTLLPFNHLVAITCAYCFNGFWSFDLLPSFPFVYSILTFIRFQSFIFELGIFIVTQWKEKPFRIRNAYKVVKSENAERWQERECGKVAMELLLSIEARKNWWNGRKIAMQSNITGNGGMFYCRKFTV